VAELDVSFASADEATKPIEANANTSAIIFFIPFPFPFLEKSSGPAPPLLFLAVQRERPDLIIKTPAERERLHRFL
jgi:hypothetical protein